MPLTYFSCQDFRCLRHAELEADPRFTLIQGANASGKTSLLEAVAYIGRGRSFRNASTDSLVRHGAEEFLLNARVERADHARRIGVRNGRGGLELSIDGDRGGGLAELAAALPLQVIDPDVHNLVAGGPDQRRRYFDWVGFHVEHGFLERWRRFRRVLKQRNAALKDGAGDLDAWDREFCEAGERLHESRAQTMALLVPVLETAAAGLLDEPVHFVYQRGWRAELTLSEALLASRDRERQMGSAQVGPQRAELRLRVEERMARKLVSRGQQKLLACAMVLAAAEAVQAALGRPLLLLMDDPAAELDAASLRRLMRRVATLECQVIATALVANPDAFPAGLSLFHVERGELRPAS